MHVPGTPIPGHRGGARVMLSMGGSSDAEGFRGRRRSSTELAAVPGAGLNLRLTPRFALRGDLRDVVIFGPETTHNFEASAGLAISF